MCGEPISFFAFRDQHEINRHFLIRAANRVQRRKKRGLRSFLVYGAATNDRFAEGCLINESRFGRWRRPFCGIELFHVVHKVKANRFRRPSIERCEHARLAVSVDNLSLLKSSVARQLGNVLCAFGITAVLRRDRHLCDPVLQSLYRLIVLFRDFGFDVGVIVGCCDAIVRCEREHSEADK